MATRGNMVVAQSGGPTMVINRSLIGIINEALKYSDIEYILGGKYGLEGILQEKFIDLRKEASRRLDIIARSPGAALGSCRLRPDTEICKRLFQIFKKYNVKYFFYIGGNDSAKAASIVNKIAKDEN
ncbi:6-phosphofructokinase, partial [Candidatus Sumerlaeota bacterium]|nr:6-phosphofructokinase [Candidatus Sumerlaeota bacterium]